MSDSKSSQATAPTAPDHHDEEFVHVPKGQSRLRFILMVIVILGILLAFSITPAMMGTLDGGGPGTYVTWKLPGGETRTMDSQEFVSHKRSLSAIETVMRRPQYLPTGPFDTKSDVEVAKFLVLEELALQSGMRISDQELSSQILYAFGGDGNVYQEVMRAQRRVTARQFEKALGRWMLVNRYLSWLADGATLIDPTEVEADWRAAHQEYAFDYVVVPTEDYREHAQGQLPDDAALQAWFDEKPDGLKRRYWEGPYFGVEATYLSLPHEVMPEKLIAAYPPTEGEDPEVVARGYYDLFYTSRFKKPEALKENEDELYFAYEDVKDICAIEGAAYNAMNLWMVEAQGKVTAGEEFDLAAEAERLGLDYGKQEQALTRDEWNEAELPWSGPILVRDFMGNQAGQLSRKITVEENAFVLSRVVERIEPSLPAFEKLSDRVAEDWIKDKMGAVAVIRLEQVRDLLGNRPADATTAWELAVDGEKFAEAAIQRGFTPESRAYTSRADAGKMAEGESDTDMAAAVREFLARNGALYQMQDGQLAEPRTNPRGEYAFLFRLSGARDADLETKMSPADVQNIEQRLSSSARQSFMEESFASDDWFKARTGLSIVDPISNEVKF